MKTPHSPEHICSGHAAICDYGFLLLLFRGCLGQKLVQVELILRVTEVADHLTLRAVSYTHLTLPTKLEV